MFLIPTNLLIHSLSHWCARLHSHTRILFVSLLGLLGTTFPGIIRCLEEHTWSKAMQVVLM